MIAKRLFASSFCLLALAFLAGVSINAVKAVERLEVAGISTGMSPEQAIETVTARGYRPHENLFGDYLHYGPSFDEWVKIELGEMRQPDAEGALRTANFEKPDTFETLIINFLPLPGGEVVGEVIYKIEAPGMTFEKMAELAAQKYGDADREGTYASGWHWSQGTDKISLYDRGSSGLINLTLESGLTHRDVKELVQEAIGDGAQTSF